MNTNYLFQNLVINVGDCALQRYRIKVWPSEDNKANSSNNIYRIQIEVKEYYRLNLGANNHFSDRRLTVILWIREKYTLESAELI